MNKFVQIIFFSLLWSQESKLIPFDWGGQFGYVNKNGKIINISSNAATLCSSGRSGYASSKAAIIAFTKVLSKELGRYKICVNALAPGLTDTEMKNQTSEKEINEVISQTPLNKIANPSDVANVSLFLASDLSNHVSGETIYVTGGY